MTTNTRVSLTILSVGFAIEGGAGLSSFVSRGRFHPGTSILFAIPVAMTLAGLLFVWIGQHEWNELHRDRVRQAHRVFALGLLGALVAAVTVGILALEPALGTPPWARGLFGAAVASLVIATFTTYTLLVFHLVPAPSKALLLASLTWALLVAAFVGGAMASNLPVIVGLVSRRALTVPAFVGPVDSLASYLFVSCFLLLAAYLDAHRTLVQGAPPPREGVVTTSPTAGPGPES